MFDSSGTISSAKYVETYESESMSLDYCGHMCQISNVDSTFMGVQANKCYCINDISGSLQLSNRVCNTKCPGDFAELCGGRGSISIHKLKNDSFTDVLAIVSGSFGGQKNQFNVILENGTECIDHEIPSPLPLNPENRGVTVIEDHTLVVCGGNTNNDLGMTVILIYIGIL